MKDIDAAIATLQEKYISAASSRNTSALIQLYDPEVRIFDAWGVWEYHGTDSWKIALESWLSSSPEGKYSVAFSDCDVVGSPEMATMTAIVKYALVAPDGKESHSMHNRITWVLRKSGNELFIIHEHTSAPIGFDDMKAILKRPD